jgi:hypothetical protein
MFIFKLNVWGAWFGQKGSDASQKWLRRISRIHANVKQRVPHSRFSRCLMVMSEFVSNFVILR